MKQTIAIFCLFINYFCMAQQYYDDAQLWLGIKVEKKVVGKLSAQLKLKGRGTDNITQFGRGAIDIGVNYKLTKNIKLYADYVFVKRQRKDNIYITQHRNYIAIVLKKDIGRFSFIYRNKFLCLYGRSYADNGGFYAYYFDRNKGTVKYEATKRFSFYIAEEVNIPLNNPQLKGLNRSRSYIGTQIKTTRNQQLELYFMYHIQLQNGDWYNQDDDYYVEPLKRNFVYGATYSFGF